jgi:hypothetical protein
MAICKEIGCKTRANFGFPGQKDKHCKLHKQEKMRDVKNPICLFTDCNIQPIYGFPGEKRKYCKIHKLEHMVSKNESCLFIGCDTRPSFGFPGQKAEYCKIHKLEHMVSRNPSCLFTDCNTQPYFGFPGQKPIYCNSHKLNKMIDVIHPKCTSCGLFRVKKINKYLCYYCNPDKTKTRKLKETIVKELLEKQGYEFIHDKQVSNEYCNKYRPDFVFNCGEYFVVLECDEEAHKHYDKDCEIVRMNNISMDLKKPTLFIRYNPDLTGVRKQKKHQVLIETLEKHLYKDTIQQLEPIYLFYPEH